MDTMNDAVAERLAECVDAALVASRGLVAANARVRTFSHPVYRSTFQRASANEAVLSARIADMQAMAELEREVAWFCDHGYHTQAHAAADFVKNARLEIVKHL